MYCVGCGKEVAQGVKFCDVCGTAVPLPVAAGAHPAPLNATRIDTPIWLFCVVGGMVGAITGYLSRPSAMLVGQLPFETVITGGAGLQGLDQLLVPIAQQSFNQMLAGAFVGAVLGGVLGVVLRQMRSRAS